MINEGVLDGVDEIYGIHLWNYQNVGEIGVKDGPLWRLQISLKLI